MNGGLATPLQVLTSNRSSSMLSRASIMQQLQHENGDRVERAVHRGSAPPSARTTPRPSRPPG